MSLLSHDRLSIVLSPHQIAVLHTRRRLSLRRTQLDVVGREVIPASASGENQWSGAVGALGAVLPRLARPGMWANVILSNHFVSYVLVPWRDNMSDEDEMAYARHCFKETFGDASNSWDVRVSPSRAGTPAVASAVDGSMLAELLQLLGRAGVTIKSIQPHLMLAFNSCRAAMRGRTAWFAILEPGNVCLSLLRNGQFAWMRKIRIGDAWEEEFPGVLAREAYLAEEGMETKDVFLWAPQLEGKNAMERGRWNIMHLKPPLY